MIEGYKWREELQWTHTRYVSAMIYNTTRTKKNQQKKPSQLVPLDLDGANGQPPLEIDHVARWKKFVDDLKRDNPEQLKLLR